MSPLDLQRRSFLKALGLGMALPFAARMGQLAIAQDAAPKRLFIYFVPHGWPVELGGVFGAGSSWLDRSAVLAPLTPWQAQTSVVRGISMHGATNHPAIRALLTGVGEGVGQDSIDARIAKALGVKPWSIGAIPYDKNVGFSVDSYLTKRGAWVRPTESPAAFADAVFAEPLGGEVIDESAFRRDALALTERELEGLRHELRGLTREETRLSLHLDAVRELKASLGDDTPTESTCEGAPTLSHVDAVRDVDPLEHAHFAGILDAHLEASAHALVCGSARVVSLQNLWVNNSLHMGFANGPGVDKGHHDPLSHSWDAPGRAEFASAQRWFIQRLADRLLTTLDQPDPLSPGQTVLDNTIVLVCSEVCDGAAHNSTATTEWFGGTGYETYLPMITIGGGGGSLRTGGIIDVSRGHDDLLATLAVAMGAPGAALGRPIAELLR